MDGWKNNKGLYVYLAKYLLAYSLLPLAEAIVGARSEAEVVQFNVIHEKCRLCAWPRP